MDVSEIDLDKILPQKYPFRMIDKVIEYVPGKSLKAVKNITGNEWVNDDHNGAVSHFPETLLIEAASQAALALFIFIKKDVIRRDSTFFVGKITSEFYKSLMVSDKILILAHATKILDEHGYSDVELYLDKQLLAKVNIIYSVKN